jgi:hypothetical protein
MILFHDRDDLIERCVFGDGMDFGGHNFAHLACTRSDVFICQLARTDKEFDPAGTPTHGVCFRPTQEIAFANDTSQLPRFVEHRHSADLVLEHQPHCFHD